MPSMEETVEDYLATIDILLDDDRIEWAWDTLEGIRNYVKSNRHITQRQMDTVDGYQRKVEESE